MKKWSNQYALALGAYLLFACAVAEAACPTTLPNVAVTVTYDNALGPDGQRDDTPSIQRAINTAIFCNIAIVRLDPGATYYLNTDVSQNALIIWASGITFDGNGATLVDKKSNAGFWGESIGVHGLMLTKPTKYPVGPMSNAPVGQYVVSFDQADTYTGSANLQVQHVVVENLRISHSTAPSQLNSLGIGFANDITIQNVTSSFAPQTAFAIVADSKILPISDVKLNSTTADHSNREAYRISDEYDADTLSVRLYKCGAYNIRGAVSGENDPQINGRKVAVWYRGAPNPDSELVRLTIDSCTFDESGEIFTTQGAKNLVVLNSSIYGGMTLFGGTTQKADFVLANNVFDCTYAKKYLGTNEAPIYVAPLLHGVLFRNRISGDTGPWLYVDPRAVDVAELSHYWGVGN